MKKIDTTSWKSFRLIDLFQLVPAKGINSQQLEDGDDIGYFSASKENNGFNRKVKLKGFENWVSQGNCLQFVNIGDAAAGHTNYIPEDFIAMNGKTTCGYNEKLNEFNGIFIATVLNAYNGRKFSFKDSWTGDLLKNTPIYLPVDSEGNPDWNKINEFSKKLIDECENLLKTRISVTEKQQFHKVDVTNYKKFKISDLFETNTIGGELKCPTGSYIKKQFLKEEGTTPRITVSGVNNGVTGYFDILKESKNYRTYNNFISVSFLGSVFYQKGEASLDMKVHCLKPLSIELNENLALFLISCIKASLRKISYADQISSSELAKMDIYLPADPEGNPNWKYMEDFLSNIKDSTEHKLDSINEEYTKTV